MFCTKGNQRFLEKWLTPSQKIVKMRQKHLVILISRKVSKIIRNLPKDEGANLKSLSLLKEGNWSISKGYITMNWITLMCFKLQIHISTGGIKEISWPQWPQWMLGKLLIKLQFSLQRVPLSKQYLGEVSFYTIVPVNNT